MMYRKLSAIAVLLVGLLALAGCQSGTQSSDGSAPVDFNYQLAYLLEQTTGSSAASSGTSSPLFVATDVFTGSLTATNTDTSDVFTFNNWSVYVDEATLDVQSNNTIILFPGTYDLALSVSRGDHTYVGETLGASIVDGTNTIPLTLAPVIGDVNSDVIVVARLVDFRFQYPPAELAVLTNPRIGIIVDGAATEDIFAVNPATGLSAHMHLDLTPGPHNIRLKLYDGAIQRGKSLVPQEDQNLSPGVNVVMDLVSLAGETVVSLDVAGGDATFNFTVPAEVINEAGGLSELRTVMTLVSAETGLMFEQVLALSPAGSDYAGQFMATGFQFEDVTISLSFTDTGDAPEELLGSCVQVVTLTTSAQSVPCNLTLRRRAVIGGNLLATVGINVFNTGDEPVAGASVFANGNLVGLTGSGAFGTDGYLKVFLVAGPYNLRAQTAASWGDTNATAVPLGINNEVIILDHSLSALGAVSIPFSPEAFPLANVLAISSCDDCTSGLIPIGFNFSFFGNVYSQFNVSTNGIVGFDSGMSQACCSGRPIPSNDFINNIVAVAWTDLDPGNAGSATISWELRGTAPDRRLIVQYNLVPEFNTAIPVVTSQMILRESDSSIEVHATQMDLLANFGHVYTQGVENAAGTVAAFIPGRVASNFSLTNDGVRFGTH